MTFGIHVMEMHKKTRQAGSSGEKRANQNQVSRTNQKNSRQFSGWEQHFPSQSDSSFLDQSEKFVSAQQKKATLTEPIRTVIIRSRKPGSSHIERTNQNWVSQTNQKNSCQANVKRVFPPRGSEPRIRATAVFVFNFDDFTWLNRF